VRLLAVDPIAAPAPAICSTALAADSESLQLGELVSIRRGRPVRARMHASSVGAAYSWHLRCTSFVPNRSVYGEAEDGWWVGYDGCSLLCHDVQEVRVLTTTMAVGFTPNCTSFGRAFRPRAPIAALRPFSRLREQVLAAQRLGDAVAPPIPAHACLRPQRLQRAHAHARTHTCALRARTLARHAWCAGGRGALAEGRPNASQPWLRGKSYAVMPLLERVPAGLWPSAMVFSHQDALDTAELSTRLHAAFW
jgi:hypothetical protein